MPSGNKARRKPTEVTITVLGRKVIDTANLRIKYAWGATDITQDSTYLDCGQLLIGQHMTKYSSWFVEVADSQRVEWAQKNPHPQGVPNGTWWMRGKTPGIWSEYQYSNIFIHGDTLNEWAVMPMGQEWPQRYEEKWNGQDWTLQGDTASFLGHQLPESYLPLARTRLRGMVCTRHPHPSRAVEVRRTARPHPKDSRRRLPLRLRGRSHREGPLPHLAISQGGVHEIHAHPHVETANSLQPQLPEDCRHPKL